MKESDFNKAVNDRLNPSRVKSWKIRDDFQGGVPDNWYLGTCKETNGKKLPLFVEYKYLKAVPKRESTRIMPALSAQQVEWIQMLHSAGQKVLVIVGCPNGRTSAGVIFYPSECVEGIPQKDFIERRRSYLEIADAITAIVNGIEIAI